jgi:hypothetical protein
MSSVKVFFGLGEVLNLFKQGLDFGSLVVKSLLFLGSHIKLDEGGILRGGGS